MLIPVLGYKGSDLNIVMSYKDFLEHPSVWYDTEGISKFQGMLWDVKGQTVKFVDFDYNDLGDKKYKLIEVSFVLEERRNALNSEEVFKTKVLTINNEQPSNIPQRKIMNLPKKAT